MCPLRFVLLLNLKCNHQHACQRPVNLLSVVTPAIKSKLCIGQCSVQAGMRAPRTPYWTWSLGSIRTRKNTELTEDVYMCIEKNVHNACGFDTPPIRIRYGWHSLIRDKWVHFQSLYILSLVKRLDASQIKVHFFSEAFSCIENSPNILTFVRCVGFVHI